MPTFKPLLFGLFLFSSSVFSQQKAGVWGKLKQNEQSFWLYVDYYHGPVTCKLNFASAILARQSFYYIISDTFCEKQSKAFVVLHNNSRYMIDSKDFSNTNEIEEELKKIIIEYPSMNDREKQALKEMPADLDRMKQEEIRIKAEEEKKVKRELDSLQKLIDKSLSEYRQRNWVLWTWSWSYSNEYSKFVDVDITVINPYKQRIKYIWFTFVAFNPVNDPIKDGISGKLEKTVQGIGPIEYGDRGTYNFEDVFYSNVIETMRVNQIKIQFFDGTVKIITRPQTIKRDD